MENLVVNTQETMLNHLIPMYISNQAHILSQVVARQVELDIFIDFRRIGGVKCPEENCREPPFINTKVLFLHILSAHRGQWFICGICSESFISRDLLDAHYDRFHRNESGGKIKEFLSAINVANNLYGPRHINNNFPVICIYRDNESVLLGCHFLRNIPQDGTEFDTKVMLKTCLQNPVLRKSVVCQYLDVNGYLCHERFDTCREMVLHLTTHFRYKAFCILCLELYDTASDIVHHMDNIHQKCIVCNMQFEDSYSIEAHKSEIRNRVAPYVRNADDYHCTLFLPNIAYHLGVMERITMMDAVDRDHPCQDMNAYLYSIVNDSDKERDVVTKVSKCFTNPIVEDISTQRTCAMCIENTLFHYTNCREFLVHILLRHSDKTDYRHICNICKDPYLKQELAAHLTRHGKIVCLYCLKSFNSRLSLVLHEFACGHTPA